MPPKGQQKKRLRGGDSAAAAAAASATDDTASVEAGGGGENDDDDDRLSKKRHVSPTPPPVSPIPMETSAPPNNDDLETQVIQKHLEDTKSPAAAADANGIEEAIANDDFSTEQDHQTKFADPNEFMRQHHPLYWRNVLDKIKFQVTEFGKGASKNHKINAVVEKGVGIGGKPEYKQARWISPFAYISSAMVFPFGNRYVDFPYVKAGKFGERVHPYNKFTELHRSATLSTEPWFPDAPMSNKHPNEYQEMADYVDAMAQVQRRFVLFMITDPTARGIKAVNDLYGPALEAAKIEKKRPIEALAELAKEMTLPEYKQRQVDEYNRNNQTVTVTPEEILEMWPTKELFFRRTAKVDVTPAAGAAGAADDNKAAAATSVQTQAVVVPTTATTVAAAAASEPAPPPVIMPRQLNVENYVFQQEKPDFVNKKKLELSPEFNNDPSLRHYANFLAFAKKYGYILTPFTFKDAQNRPIPLEHGFLDFGDVAAVDTVLDCIPNSKDKSSIALRLGGVIHYMARNRCNELLGRQYQSRNATMSENVDFPALPGTLGMFEQDAMDRAERLLKKKQQEQQQQQPPIEGPPSYSASA